MGLLRYTAEIPLHDGFSASCEGAYYLLAALQVHSALSIRIDWSGSCVQTTSAACRNDTRHEGGHFEGSEWNARPRLRLRFFPFLLGASLCALTGPLDAWKRNTKEDPDSPGHGHEYPSSFGEYVLSLVNGDRSCAGRANCHYALDPLSDYYRIP